ncbi:hypothetical protein LIOPPNJA_25150 [Robbsia andropogonis]|uniref:hypothetical protein n=1 Tax=Robbsia andropogonis TaxID=28092 RepID=UPI0020A116B4|nr:hypothetical protein [Robbsia andropogonis]MCP1131067.1 hypothetical protein [Robbsia andropogonis]
MEADEAKCDALEKALREASAAIHAYAQRLDVWSEDQKSRAGVYIYVDQYGELQIERGLVKPTDNANTEGQDIAGAQTTAPTKVKSLHGETLCERLSAHRTAAVQAELMAQPTIALAYLMSAMVPRVFCEHYQAAGQHALDVEFRPTHDRLLQVADDMAASKAWLFIDGEQPKVARDVAKQGKRFTAMAAFTLRRCPCEPLCLLCLSEYQWLEPVRCATQYQFAGRCARTRHERVLESNQRELFQACDQTAHYRRGCTCRIS